MESKNVEFIETENRWWLPEAGRAGDEGMLVTRRTLSVVR